MIRIHPVTAFIATPHTLNLIECLKPPTTITMKYTEGTIAAYNATRYKGDSKNELLVSPSILCSHKFVYKSHLYRQIKPLSLRSSSDFHVVNVNGKIRIFQKR